MDYSKYLTADKDTINYIKSISHETISTNQLLKIIYDIAKKNGQKYHHGIYYYTSINIESAMSRLK